MTNLKDAMTKKDEEIARLRVGKTSGEKSLTLGPKAASDIDNCSELSDKQSESSSQRSTDEFRHHKDVFEQARLVTADGLSENGVGNAIKDLNDDTDLLGLGDVDSEERLSDISDGALSMGTETDGSLSSIVELTLFPETAKAPAEHQQKCVSLLN